MRTAQAKMNEIQRDWQLINAANRPLGRLASEVAVLLRGKHKPQFTSHVDTGDFVVVINAAQIHLTGRKWTDKKYYSHSGFFGSLKTKAARNLSGTQLIRQSVLGMLPKNKMRRKLIKKLKIYETASHPHQSQKPTAISAPLATTASRPSTKAVTPTSATVSSVEVTPSSKTVKQSHSPKKGG